MKWGTNKFIEFLILKILGRYIKYPFNFNKTFVNIDKL